MRLYPHGRWRDQDAGRDDYSRGHARSSDPTDDVRGRGNVARDETLFTACEVMCGKLPDIASSKDGLRSGRAIYLDSFSKSSWRRKAGDRCLTLNRLASTCQTNCMEKYDAKSNSGRSGRSSGSGNDCDFTGQRAPGLRCWISSRTSRFLSCESRPHRRRPRGARDRYLQPRPGLLGRPTILGSSLLAS